MISTHAFARSSLIKYTPTHFRKNSKSHGNTSALTSRKDVNSVEQVVVFLNQIYFRNLKPFSEKNANGIVI